MRAVVEQIRGAVRRWRSVSVGEARRFNIATQERWRPRAEIAVDMLVTGGPAPASGQSALRVSDFGAGNELVGRLLAGQASYPVRYSAYDLQPQRPSTTPLDVRDGLPDAPADVAVALGLIEYLPDSDPILERLAAHARYVVLSYVGFDEARRSVRERAALGWVRHQTGEQLDQALAGSGLMELSRRWTDAGETTIRLMESARQRPAERS